MARLFVFLGMLCFACLLAGAYGAAHNQISYTVGPDYFHEFKFKQFHIPQELHNRTGAAWVGVQASWWMGLVIGLPIAVLSLGTRDIYLQSRRFFNVSVAIVVFTIALGATSLLFSPPVGVYSLAHNVSDTSGFAQAAMLHDTSYLAGALGLVCGIIWMVYRLFRN